LSFVKCLFIGQWDFCLCIIFIHALCLRQFNHPSSTFAHPFPPFCFFKLCSAYFLVSCSYTDVKHLFVFCYLSFLLFLLPGVLYQYHFWIHALYIFLCISNYILHSGGTLLQASNFRSLGVTWTFARKISFHFSFTLGFW
jgi:hypothetical protein